MSFLVVITEQAEREIKSAYEWWADNRSKRQADQWYIGISKAIAELSENAERHGKSRESDSFAYEIRDLYLESAGGRRIERCSRFGKLKWWY